MKYLRRHRNKRGTLRADQNGATALEFALISPIVIMMMMGTVEYSLMMFAQNVMESATFNSSRLGKTGFSPQGQSRTEAIVADITARTNGLLDADKLQVTGGGYQQFGQVGQPEAFTDTNGNGQYNPGENYVDVNGNGQWDQDMGTAGYGGTGDVVVYTVTYPWDMMTPVVQNFFGTNGVVTLSARAVVKNEPW